MAEGVPTLKAVKILADGTQEIVNDNTEAVRHSFLPTSVAEAGNPQHISYSDEVLYEVPEYDPNNPDNSKVTFSVKWTIEVLSSSDDNVIYGFGGTDSTGYMSVKIVTEGIRQ